MNINQPSPTTSIKQSLNALINAYDKGLLPSGLYYPGTGNGPEISHPVYDKIISGDEDSLAVISEAKFSLNSLLKTFKRFSTVFKEDGSFNPRSSIAESYAITLALEDKYSISLQMFDAITAEGFKISIRRDYDVPPVVNKFGILGFEGAIQYAHACMELGKADRAKELYGAIADLPRKCTGAIRFGDVKVEALDQLVYGFGMNGYKSSLLLAKKDQY